MVEARKSAVLRVTPTPVVWWLTTLGLGVAIGLLVLGAAVLWDARQDAWRQSVHASDNLALSMEREIQRTLAVYDLSLQGAVEAFGLAGIDEVPGPLRHAAIFDRAANAEYLGSLLVLNAAGDIVADSTSFVPHVLNLGDRDYFRIQKSRPNVGLFVSQPFRSRLRGGDPSISISRRLQDRNGQFRGVVVGTLRLSYFEDMFRRVRLGADGTVLLMGTDGRLVVRQPASVGDLGRDLSGSPLLQHAMQSRAGLYETRSMIDGVERWVTYRQVGDLPLLLALSVSTNTIYAEWWHKAIGIGSILLILSAAIVGLILLFRAEMVRRLRAETALMTAAARLEVIAATDGLTGLTNRGAFEAALRENWARAISGQTAIALLMMDADWFKPFNDRYGHPMGDEALRQIARCIERTIRRPSDIGARYGGEEFVVLIPNTERADVIAIAERICAAVAAMAMPHEGSPLGHLTVSVGVAVLRPRAEDLASDLVRDADLALYAAKRDGRARVAAPLAVPLLDDQRTGPVQAAAD